jgi:4-amino-4-deoxy-L-arabinose transferase-like glycosyltransferase
MKQTPKAAATVVLLLLCALALGTRFWGLDWGLPHTYHVDENWFAGKSIQFFGGNLDPEFFHVPTLHMYLVAGLWRAYYALGRLAGSFEGPEDFRSKYINQPTPFYLLGRTLSALFSVGTVLLLFLLGSRMFGRRAGVLAALLLIFALDHNRISHDMLPDVPMVFFLVLSLWFIWKVYTRGRTGDYLLAGLAAGAAMSLKYGGQMMFLPLFLAHLFRVLENRRPRWEALFSPKLIGAGLVFVAAFLAGSPYIVLNFKKFWSEFRWQTSHLMTEGHFGSSFEEPAWLFYLKHGFRENVGLLAQFLVLGGVILGLVRRERRDLLVLSYPVVLFLLIATWKARATRYLMPLAPFFILAGAAFLDAVLGRLGRAVGGRGGKLGRFALGAGGVVLVAAILFPSAREVVRVDAALAGTNSRTAAKEWIHRTILPGTRIALESYDPPISRERYSVVYRHTLGEIDLEWLSLKKVEYVVTTDTMSERFTRNPQEDPKRAGFYLGLEREAVLVKTFRPAYQGPLLDLHFPTLRVFRLSQAAHYGFPGNFGRYAQDIRLERGAGGWSVRSSVAASSWLPANERVRNPYLRLTDRQGRELGRFVLHEGEISAAESFSCESGGTVAEIPEGSRVHFGYEYALSPNPLPVPTEGPFRKEIVLPERVDKASLASGRWSSDYAFVRFPGERGDDYFQSLTLTRKEKTASLRSQVFGGGLRYREDFVRNPFVLLRGAEGEEVKKLVVFEGTLGSLQSDRFAPAQAGDVFPAPPVGVRVFVGYDFYFNKNRADAAGGPELVEVFFARSGRAEGKK